MAKNINTEMPRTFTSDPRKNLEIENEILRMKLAAEAGAVIGIREDISPELENVFLQNVIAFEEAGRDVKMINLYDFLGRPSFRKLDELDPAEVQQELARLMQLLEEKKVMLDVLDKYDDPTLYRFITEELFLEDTYEEIVPGMVRHYTYEDFHPNHKIDIRERTMDFLGDWFERKMSEQCWELNKTFVLPDGTLLKRPEVVQRIRSIFAVYTSFVKCQYAIGDIGYEWNDREGKGLGYCEGAVKYQAVTASGKEVPVEGPFKLYLSNEGNWWSIFYFVFPGFSWHE